MNAKAAKSSEEHDWPPIARVNPDLVGHDQTENLLADAFHGERMAHAWLISGPKGIGKATLAHRFSRYVLSQGVDGDSDGMGLFGDDLPETSIGSLWTDPESTVFRRITAGGHADLMCIERSLNKQGKLRNEIVIDDVRGIGGFLSLTAAEGGWRVVIIDSADEMNRNAANAVLKVLEEPPARALLVLLSHSPGRLLPTIRSRCRKLVMPGLSGGDMDALLERYLPDVSPGDRAELGKLADGSIGRAIDLSRAGGIGLYRDILGLLRTCPGVDVPELHKLAGNWSKIGADQTFSTAMDILRNILSRLIRGFAANGIVEGVAAEETEIFQRLSSTADLDRWLKVWEKINNLLDRTNAINLDRKQVVLNIFLEIDGAARSGQR
jgi:DNA polymerase III subunit delta'